jgi:hypothetical protein
MLSVDLPHSLTLCILSRVKSNLDAGLFKYPVIERNMQGMDACELQYDIDGRQP